MKKFFFSAMLLALLTSCSSANGGSSAPLKKIADAVMLCEGAPLETSRGAQDYMQQISDKNHKLKAAEPELIGATLPTEGNDGFCVGIDSALSIKSIEVGYGHQYAHVEFEAIIKMTSNVPSHINYVVVGYDGDKPCVMFYFQNQRWMEGNKESQWSEKRAEGDRLRLSHLVTINMANANLFANATRFVITVENDPDLLVAEEAMEDAKDEYCRKYGR